MTGGGGQPTDRLRLPPLGDSERQALGPWLWLMAVAAVLVAVIGVIAAVSDHLSARTGPGPNRSTGHVAQLPANARPLPAATGGAATSFGTLGPADAHQDIGVSRADALRHYDHIPGVASRHGHDRRVFTALVRAAYVDGTHVVRGTFWVISVWFHPPDIGVAPQRQWCVDHGLVDVATGEALGHIYGCLPRGSGPRTVRPAESKP